MSLIEAHGGRLVDRLAVGARAQELRREAEGLAKIRLSAKQSCDLEMITIGAFSPLEGFMGSSDVSSVCRSMRLSNGTPWPIPITLAVGAEVAGSVREGSRVALVSPTGVVQGVMSVREVFSHDKGMVIPATFRTQDPAHPGVKAVLDEGETCLAGPIESLVVCADPGGPEAFVDLRLTPAQTREAFGRLGWRTVVAFQTRNPIHRAHEYVCKCAQELVDGLLIHPLVGETKKGDIPADVRMRAIDALVRKYFNARTTMVSVMPAAMRYAGPREAVLHAIVRKNYGCTHFIVGRDHAGVGNYYGTYDAQRIFDEMPSEDRAALGIQIMRFEHTGYSRSYGGMVSRKTYPEIDGDVVNLSGTAVREMLSRGERPPAEFTRPEVADVLIEWARSVR